MAGRTSQARSSTTYSRPSINPLTGQAARTSMNGRQSMMLKPRKSLAPAEGVMAEEDDGHELDLEMIKPMPNQWDLKVGELKKVHMGLPGALDKGRVQHEIEKFVAVGLQTPRPGAPQSSEKQVQHFPKILIDSIVKPPTAYPMHTNKEERVKMHNRHYKEGLRQNEEGSFQEAANAFHKAYRVVNKPGTLLCYANMRLKLGEASLALAIYREISKMDMSAVEAQLCEDKRVEAKSLMAEQLRFYEAAKTVQIMVKFAMKLRRRRRIMLERKRLQEEALEVEKVRKQEEAVRQKEEMDRQVQAEAAKEEERMKALEDAQLEDDDEEWMN